jgi:Fic family protein
MVLANKLENSPMGTLALGREGYRGFVPLPLPEQVALSSDLVYLLDEASRSVAMLSGVGETLPNPRLLINPFLRREAVLSSRIEGTQASVSDVLRYEAFEDRSAARSEDVREVINYMTALNEGLRLLKSLPISVRLVNEIHGVLLEGVRGGDQGRGALRDRQVWIGTPGTPITEARFVPAPSENVADLMGDWERWVNGDQRLAPLVKCALMHYQFETIHPYRDGNGRIGRLLIILFLSERQVLTTPLLYLSAYFERNRGEYYDHLLNVSLSGEWSPWLEFFLTGVVQEARDALERSRRVRALHLDYRDRLQRARQSGTTLQLLDEVFARPILTAASVARLLSITNQGARNVLERLVSAGILEPETGWPRFYVARELLQLTAD